MKLYDHLKKFKLNKLQISAPFMQAEIQFEDSDKKAAWELYIELLTRITTQPLPKEYGMEEAALGSIYSLFPTTRDILKRSGRECKNFTKISIVVLNQIVRPCMDSY